MAEVTASRRSIRWAVGVVQIAAVSDDDEMRMQLARAFDRAPASWSIRLLDHAPDDADVIVCGPGDRIEGAIAFDPADPERLLSDIDAVVEKRSRGRRIFVSGATGGSGATTIALHLAALARSCVLEMDGTGVRRRLRMASARSWDPDDGSPIEQAALPVAPGLRVLLAPPSSAGASAAAVVEAAVRTFSTVYVDGGIRSLQELAGPSDICVLVMLPTRPAAERAREILDAIDGSRWALVANRVGPGSGLTRRRLEAILGRKISIELPCAAGLRDAEDEGSLVTSPFSPWLWRLKRLWRALEAA